MRVPHWRPGCMSASACSRVATQEFADYPTLFSGVRRQVHRTSNMCLRLPLPPSRLLGPFLLARPVRTAVARLCPPGCKHTAFRAGHVGLQCRRRGPMPRLGRLRGPTSPASVFGGVCALPSSLKALPVAVSTEPKGQRAYSGGRFSKRKLCRSAPELERASAASVYFGMARLGGATLRVRRRIQSSSTNQIQQPPPCEAAPCTSSGVCCRPSFARAWLPCSSPCRCVALPG